MTIIVGVQCTDGVVIGTDSMATSTMGQNPLVQLLSNDKLQAVDSKTMLATTGSVGLGQRFQVHIKRACDEKKFRSPCIESMATIAKLVVQDFSASGVARSNQHGFSFGALLAAIVDDKPHLIEFQTTDLQPELKHGRMFSVSIGSGQLLADPFLAFVNRVLWQETMPDVELGKIGVYWVLEHTIKYAPGGVGAPIVLGVLKKTNNQWGVSISEETQEQAQFISELEQKIHSSPLDAIASALPSEPPEPPAAS